MESENWDEIGADEHAGARPTLGRGRLPLEHCEADMMKAKIKGGRDGNFLAWKSSQSRLLKKFVKILLI